MEEIRNAALAYYHTGSLEQKQLAWEFFKSMDENGDDRVDFNEFIKFLRERDVTILSNPYFFRELDRDGDGSLDFWEVLTLYYIAKCRRPFCDWCGIFITGLFFTCVQCFECNSNSYDLCSNCYRGQRFKHAHSFFLDNFLLLERHRRLPLQEAAANQVQSTDLQLVPVQTQAASTSRMEKVKMALETFESVLSIGSVGFMVATYCSIM